MEDWDGLFLLVAFDFAMPSAVADADEVVVAVLDAMTTTSLGAHRDVDGDWKDRAHSADEMTSMRTRRTAAGGWKLPSNSILFVCWKIINEC